jgi:basic amino acid/polyamine antiporter, APA family
MSIPAPAGAQPGLVRAIGRWDLTAGVVNAVVGAGIFALPATLAALTGAWSPVAVLAGGIAAFVIVLCFAEVASRFDQAGGPYLFARTAFGTFVGFQVGWLHIWTRLFSAAAVLNVFVAYCVPFVPAASTAGGRALVMIAITAIAVAINIAGVRQAAWTVDLFTIGKLVPLGLLIALGAAHVGFDSIAAQAGIAPRWTEALALAMFAYGGFESAIVAAGETRKPRTDTAFALAAAIGIVAALYIAVQVVVISVLPDAGSSSAPVIDALGRLLGYPGVVLGGLAALVSIYGWITGFCLMTPRIVYAMANAGELPRAFGVIHPRYRTPHLAILANALVALGLALAGSFAGTAAFSVMTRLTIFIVTCAALLALRRRSPEPTFRLPAGSAIAPLAIAYCLWLLGTRSLREMGILGVVLAIGAILWAVGRYSRKTE